MNYYLKFLVWFIGGLVGTMLLINIITNPFIFSLFIALFLGFLGARENE